MQTVLEPFEQTPTKRRIPNNPQTNTSTPPLESPLERQIRIGAIPEPIDPELVKSEKKRLLHEARLACGAPWPLCYLAVRNIGVASGMSIAIVSCLWAIMHIGLGAYVMLSTVSAGIIWTDVVSHAWATLGFFILASLMFATAAWCDNYRIPSWERREYHDFADNCVVSPVPREVENLASEIEARLPGTYLFVDRLVHTTDPFFGIRYCGKDYFLHHWD